MEQNEPSTGEIVRALRLCHESKEIECYECACRVIGGENLCRTNQLADRLESQERTIADKGAKIAELTARAEQAEAAITEIEHDYNMEMICNQCESGNKGDCHYTSAFFGCGFKYDRRGLPQDGEGKCFT